MVGSAGDSSLGQSYKGGAAYGTRLNKARDAGVLLHCIGPNESGPGMTSYEFQIIEGGTGDILLVNSTKTSPVEKRIPLTLSLKGYSDGNRNILRRTQWF